MFLVVQRTSTLPEMRALADTDHVVAVMPVGGGVRTKLDLPDKDTWQSPLPFARAGTVFREGIELAA